MSVLLVALLCNLCLSVSLSSATVTYTTLDSHNGDITVIGIATNSHVTVSTYTGDGIVKAKNVISAAWGTQQSR